MTDNSFFNSTYTLDSTYRIGSPSTSFSEVFYTPRNTDAASSGSDKSVYNYSVASETCSESDHMNSTETYEKSQPALDFSRYLDDMEKIDSDYPQDCASMLWEVYYGRNDSWSQKFGRDDQFQLQMSTEENNSCTFTVHYYGDVVGKSADYWVRLYGKGGLLERRFQGPPLKKYIPDFKAIERHIYNRMDILYIYVYTRVVDDLPRASPWLEKFVDGPFFYKFHDFTVKLKDGEVDVCRAVLAEFCPYFRAFLDVFPDEDQICLMDYKMDTFKRTIDFMITRRPLDEKKIDLELASMAKLFGCIQLIAEIDHQMTYWADLSSLCQRAVFSERLDYPVLKRECGKLIGLHWTSIFEMNKKYIMDHKEYFIKVKTGPFLC